MQPIAVRLRAYQPNGASLGLLPDPLKIDASVGREAGAMTLEYSRVRRGGPLLRRGLAQGLEVALEISRGAGWVEPYGCRYLLLKRSRDLIDATDTLKVTLPSYGWLLGKARNNDAAHLGEDGSREFTNATPGAIVDTMLAENAARGGIPLVAGFTAALDSAGQPWAQNLTMTYNLGADLTTVVEKLSEQGVIDWTTDGRTLLVFNAGQTNRELADTVRLHLGVDVVQAPDEESLEEVVDSVLIRGDEGLTITVANPTAATPWGFWEGYISQGGVSDEATARLFSQHELARLGRVRGQYTRTLKLDGARPVPLLDYSVGDWIAAPITGRKPERVQVQQVTITRDAAGVGASLVLGDKVVDLEVRRAKRLAGATGGASGMGGGAGGVPTFPPFGNNATPNKPTGLRIEERKVVPPGAIAARSEFTFSWVPPALNTDGSICDDLDSHEVTFTVWGDGQLNDFPLIAAWPPWGNPQVPPPKGILGPTIVAFPLESLDAYFSAPNTYATAAVRAIDKDGNASEWASFNFSTMSFGNLAMDHIWGTMNERVSSIEEGAGQGPRGEKGDPGPQGEPGPRGEKGDPGDAGSIGEALAEGVRQAQEKNVEQDDEIAKLKRRAGKNEGGDTVQDQEIKVLKAIEQARRAREAAGRERERKARETVQKVTDAVEAAKKQVEAHNGALDGNSGLRKRYEDLEERVKKSEEGGDTIRRTLEEGKQNRKEDRDLIDWIIGLWHNSASDNNSLWFSQANQRTTSAMLRTDVNYVADRTTNALSRVGAAEGVNALQDAKIDNEFTRGNTHATLLGGLRTDVNYADGRTTNALSRVGAAEGVNALQDAKIDNEFLRGNTHATLLGGLRTDVDYVAGRATAALAYSTRISNLENRATSLESRMNVMETYVGALRTYMQAIAAVIRDMGAPSVPAPPTIPW